MTGGNMKKEPVVPALLVEFIVRNLLLTHTVRLGTK